MASATEEPLIRVVVTADNHLAPRLSRLPAARAAARRERLRQAFAATVNAAIERKADLFVEAGDLFDVPDPINQDREFVAGELLRLRRAGIMVCAVSGNHDMPRQSVEYGGTAPLGVYGALNALHYFPRATAMRPFLFERNGLKMAIAGVSNDPGRRQGEDPLADVALEDPTRIMAQADVGLLIVHAALTDGNPHDLLLLSEAECIIRPESLARMHAKGFQVVVTGHIHRYQRRTIGGMETIVCGPSERMDFGDPPDAAGYAWLAIGAGGLRHDEHVRFTAQPRHTLVLETSEIWPQGDHGEGNDAANRFIIERLKPLCTPEALVRLRLQGDVTREQYRELDLRQIFNWGQEHCFAFELSEHGLRWLDTLRLDGDVAIMRGERVAPRQMLTAVVEEQLAQASGDAPGAELWQETRAALLAQFDALGGDEG
jgi:DNA repair exonuclease SbcCD nuclease subunit